MPAGFRPARSRAAAESGSGQTAPGQKKEREIRAVLRDLAEVSDTSGTGALPAGLWVTGPETEKVCAVGTSWRRLSVSTLPAPYSLASEHMQPVLVSRLLSTQVPTSALGDNILSNDVTK